MEGTKNSSPKRDRNNGKSDLRKPMEEGQSFAVLSALPTSFAKVPELIYVKDQPSPNWVTFRDLMYEGAIETYKDDALIFKKNDFDPLPTVERPTKAQIEADDTGLVIKEYMSRYQDANKLERESIERRKALFGVLHKAIPKDIWQILSATDNFATDIELKQDTKALWKLLNQLCGTGASSNRTLLELNVKDKFFSMRQKERQSLTEYYEEAKSIIELFTAAGIDPPDSETQVLKFLKGADSKRYGEAVSKIHNEVKFFAAKYPKSLSDANAYLREYKAEQNAPDPIHTAAMQSVYKTVAAAKAKQKANKGGGRGKQGNGEKNTNSQPNPNSHNNCTSEEKPCEKPHESPRVPTTPCKLCENLGFPGELHWQSKCPRHDEAMAILARHASELKSKPANQVHVMSNDSQEDDPYGGLTYYANLKPSYVVKVFEPNPNAPKNPEDDFDVYMDNESAVDLIHNPKLLMNIRELKVPETIIGIGNQTITVRLCGDLRYYGTVLYSAEAGVNVLSFGKSSIDKTRKVGYNNLPDNMFWLLSQGRLFNFKFKNFNFVCNMRTNQPDSPPIAVHTVYSELAEPNDIDSELLIKPAIAKPAIVPIIATVGDKTHNVPLETILDGNFLPTVQENNPSSTEFNPGPLPESITKPPDMSEVTRVDGIGPKDNVVMRNDKLPSASIREPIGHVTKTHDKDCDDAAAAAIAGVDHAQRHRILAAQQLHQLPQEYDRALPQAADPPDPHLVLPPDIYTGALETHTAASINGGGVPAQEGTVSDSGDEDEIATATGETETAAVAPAPTEPHPSRKLTRTRVPLSNNTTTETLTASSLERIQRDISKPRNVMIAERYKHGPHDATKPLQDQLFRALRVQVLEWNVNE